MIRIIPVYGGGPYCEGCGGMVGSVSRSIMGEAELVGHTFTFQNGGLSLNFALCNRCETEIVHVLHQRTNALEKS